MTDSEAKSDHLLRYRVEKWIGVGEDSPEPAMNLSAETDRLRQELRRVQRELENYRELYNTERTFSEQERFHATRLSQLINAPVNLHEFMASLITSLQEWSGCEAVGIRLRDGGDYPYYETRGFSPAFVEAENHLCAYGPDGKILCDGRGNPVLECMCGNILCGRFDLAKPFFTHQGSFWSNNTTALLASSTEADRQARTRNRCNGEGYESVALIPLRCGDQVFGLLQFNDHRPNRFTPAQIAHFEMMADNLAISLSRHQAEEALRKSGERFNLAIQATNDGLWEWNLKTNKESFSTRWCEIIGYSFDDPELKHTFKSWPELIHPDDYERVMNALTDHLEKLANFDIEYRHRHKSGEYRWQRSRGLAVFDESGKPLKIVGWISDITDRKHAETELIDAKSAAEAANKAKSAFLAIMSHEIRTPLNGVIGMADLLGFTSLTQEQRDYLDTLKSSGNILLSLINNVLDLAKIEKGKIELEQDCFHLREVIDQVADMLQKNITDKQLEISVHLEPELNCSLCGDRMRVMQILLNLLGNAVKFTAQGGITISAKILEHHDISVLVHIELCDTGIGISAEALEAVFKPFVQEDGSITRQFEGTGLGLTISRTLAELMGGSISVESTPGAGSCFIIVIPFAIALHSETVAAAPEKYIINKAASPLRILLAEDNPANSRFVKSLLNKLGHDVVTAANGSDCLGALEQYTFDLVLMDIQMPVMSGEDVLKEIRRKEQGSDLHQQIIALTAYSLLGEKERLMQEGFDGYISKPIDIPSLMNEIRMVMGVVDASC